MGAQGCLQGAQHTEKPVHSWQAGFVLQAWRLSELPREDIRDGSPRAVLPAPRPPELPSPSTRGHPLVRLGLPSLGQPPSFAVVLYFWHISLPSSSSKARRKNSKIRYSGRKCLLWTRFSPPLFPLPGEVRDFWDSHPVHSRACEDIAVSSWVSE